MSSKKQNFRELREIDNILNEYWEFICKNKKFWLIPIILILLLLGILMIFGSTSAAPFIYTLF
jgi:hypothetical protein